VNQSISERFDYRQEAVKRGIHTLKSLKERLDFAVPVGEGPATPEPASADRPPTTRSVFVVHGRNLGLRDRVARVLEKLALEAIILEEQAWRGRAVIEKFEEHSDAAEFAVVILSADDWGRGPDDADWTREKPNERART
jgi:predicted nucleotide-binding protein